jgi:hypothetical protein
VCVTTLWLSAGCAQDILSLVASFPGNPSLGARSLCHETGSNICAVAAPVPGPVHACHCRGPRGIILTASSLVGGVLVHYVMHLLLTAVVPSGV